MSAYDRQKENQERPFKLKNFDELNVIGNIPISLGRFQMTGEEDQLVRMLANSN